MFDNKLPPQVITISSSTAVMKANFSMGVHFTSYKRTKLRIKRANDIQFAYNFPTVRMAMQKVSVHSALLKIHNSVLISG